MIIIISSSSSRSIFIPFIYFFRMITNDASVMLLYCYKVWNIKYKVDIKQLSVNQIYVNYIFESFTHLMIKIF